MTASAMRDRIEWDAAEARVHREGVWIRYVFLCKLKAYHIILFFFAAACQLKVHKQQQKATGYTRTKFG
jgi:hypothetical protein